MSVSTFITNLQNSDGNRKFRWLVGLTIFSMAIIIGVWMLAVPDKTSSTVGLIRKEDQPGFFGKIAISAGNVIDILRTKTANTLNYFNNKISKTNTIEVEGKPTANN
ncbi:MAG: hypothetical protein Q7R62_02610 [bacterium]|nr:hypothetical protein [bacterium]